MTVFDLGRFCGHRFKNGGLYAGRAAKSPENACQSKHQLARPLRDSDQGDIDR